MEAQITLKNYRCFADSNPVRITLRKGLTGLVGVNNSGKSSLLRFFYEFRELFQQVSNPDGNLLAALETKRRSFNLSRSVSDIEEVFSKANNRDLHFEVELKHQPPATDHDGIPAPTRAILTVPRRTKEWEIKCYFPNRPLELSSGNCRLTADGVLSRGDSPIAQLTPICAVFQTLSEALYVGSFRNVINVGTNEAYFDIAVGQAFIQQWRHFLTGQIRRNNEVAFNLTEDIKRIFDFDHLQINPAEGNDTLQVFINGRSFRLTELGSGLAHFIIVLANAAIKNPTYILIDEPELALHPRLQLDFLTSLSSYAREGALFATHNIGLARASADWVYSVRKVRELESQITDLETTARLSEFLGELSFSGYRELGFNKILLVEGKTDVKTVQQILRVYRKDHDVVILNLSGSIDVSRMTELEEIKRISADVHVLIDSERKEEGAPLDTKREAFVQACREANINCHVLEFRAIENYLCDRAIKKVKGDKYRALQPYEKLTEVSPVWSKPESWRIAREMTKEEIDATDLGQYLDQI